MRIVSCLCYSLLVVFMTGCGKEELNWNLNKTNSFDVRHNTPCQSISCETLNNTTWYVDKISPSSTAVWNLGSGYSGNGFTLTESSYGGYIELPISILRNSKLTFWTKSLNPGASNRTPIVTVDGTVIGTAMIDGSTEYTNWMQIETEILKPGTHVVRFNFTHTSTYFQYYIDEIEIWC